MVVEVLLAEEPVAADRQAVVAGEDDEGLPGLAAGREGIEDAADLGVEVLDRRVVIGEVLADHPGRSRPGGEPLVTDLQRPVVERMPGQEVPGQWRLVGVVPVVIRPRSQAGVVRRVERHIAQERRGSCLSPEELHRGVGDPLHRMVARFSDG